MRELHLFVDNRLGIEGSSPVANRLENTVSGGKSTTKLNPSKVMEMRRLRAEGWSYPTLSRYFQVSENTVARVCKGTAWMKVTQGEAIVTDGEAELRLLANPVPLATPQDHAESIARILKAQQELEEQQSRPRAVDEIYGGGKSVAELLKEAQERRARSGPPPEPTRVRYPERQLSADDLSEHEAKEDAEINAHKLLETLKDETQKIGD